MKKREFQVVNAKGKDPWIRYENKRLRLMYWANIMLGVLFCCLGVAVLLIWTMVKTKWFWLPLTGMLPVLALGGLAGLVIFNQLYRLGLLQLKFFRSVNSHLLHEKIDVSRLERLSVHSMPFVMDFAATPHLSALAHSIIADDRYRPTEPKAEQAWEESWREKSDAALRRDLAHLPKHSKIARATRRAIGNRHMDIITKRALMFRVAEAIEAGRTAEQQREQDGLGGSKGKMYRFERSVRFPKPPRFQEPGRSQPKTRAGVLAEA